MKKMLFLLFIPLFYLHTASLFTMEFNQDVIRLFTANQINNSDQPQSYPLVEQNYIEQYYISETLPIFPVKAMYTSDDLDIETIDPMIWESNVPNPQFWKDSRGLRISDDINYTNDSYPIYLQGDSCWKIDGINKNGISIFGVIEKNTLQTTTFYVFKRLTVRRGNKEYPGTYKESLEVVGVLNSLTLESNSNRIIYSIATEEKNLLYIADIVIDQYPYKINEICTNDTLPAFKKIICLGNTHTGIENKLSEIYLGLTKEGKLCTLWYDSDKNMHCADQKSDLTFLDIAADETYQCKSGLRPKIALIDTTGKLFITDLTQKNQRQKLYCIYTAKSISSLCRLTYYDGICGIIFHNRYEQMYDCFDFITATHLFKPLTSPPCNPD